MVLIVFIFHNGGGLTRQRSILLHGSNDVVSERQIQLDGCRQAILRLLFRSARDNLDQVERVPRSKGERVVSVRNLYLSNGDACQTLQNEEAATNVRVVAPQIHGRNTSSIVPSSQQPLTHTFLYICQIGSSPSLPSCGSAETDTLHPRLEDSTCLTKGICM